MKLISWNVNGLRACLTHGFADSFAALDADIFSVQETKMHDLGYFNIVIYTVLY